MVGKLLPGGNALGKPVAGSVKSALMPHVKCSSAA